MTTAYTVRVDWAAVHEAFTKLDLSRRGDGIALGSDGLTDALGGSYFPPSFESLYGLTRLIIAERRIRDAAWRQIHDAKRWKPQVVQRACAVVIALDAVNAALAATGLVERATLDIICGTDGEFVSVTGLGWFTGASRENKRVPYTAVVAFAETGNVSALRAALEAAPLDTRHATNF